MTVRGAVLAGGAASRYGGRPKGLELVGGERMLDRIVQMVQQATGVLPLLVANASDAQEWRADLHVVRDVLPNCGSLGGIYTAVTAGDGPVLVVAWDMPFVPIDLLRALIDGAGGYDAFLPESDGPRGVEPLCGVYSPACATVIRKHLGEEDFRATGFHEDVRVGRLSRDEVAKHGDLGTMFFNVNTSDDLIRAEELWQTQSRQRGTAPRP